MHERKRINLDDLFDLKIPSNSSWFTKRFINENKGEIPVYGASKIESEVSYGYVKDGLDKVKYFKDCLTYNIDGTAGYIFLRKGKFSLSEKVKPLIVKDIYKDKVDLEYLKYILEPIFRSNVKGRKGKSEYTKLSPNMIKDIEIELPLNEFGEIDYQKQKEISNKYKTISQQKELIKERKKFINSLRVEINESNSSLITKEFELREIFDSKNGDSKYTKKYCKEHSGKFEVFTGTTIGSFGFVDKADYNYEQLTFTTDGEHAGTLQILSGEYCVGGHRTILIPKLKYVDLEYFKYTLKNVLLKKYKKSDVPSVRWNNIKNEKITLPIQKNGELDINFQKKIAYKYKIIDDIKIQLNKKIDLLLEKEFKI